MRTVAGAQRIARCCEQAIAAGVRVDMTLAHARALLTDCDIHVEPFDEQRDCKALNALASWAIRFSPIVTPDPVPNAEGLLIDVGGCQRLYHGERRLINTIANTMHWLGFRVRIAVAETYGCAWAAARFGEDERAVIDAGDERETLAPLPVEALRLDDDAIDALQEVGIDRIGHLFELPRLELASRFGSDLLLRLDQATGEAMETIDPVRPRQTPRVERAFDGPVKQLEAIMLTVRGLIEALASQLQQIECGARRLDIELERSDAGPVCETIELSHPSRDVKHLWSLARPKVETANLGFGVERITLRAIRIGRLRHEQASQWREGAQEGGGDAKVRQSLGEMVDTLAGRMGEQRTLRIGPVQSHLPERAFTCSPAMQAEGVAHNRDGAMVTMAERPSVLLKKPEPIEVMALTPDGPPVRLRWRGEACAVIAGIGPERVGQEWWRVGRDEETESRKDEAHDRINARAPSLCLSASSPLSSRDYFKVQDDGGRWLWVYRDLRTGRWFLHGQWA